MTCFCPSLFFRPSWQSVETLNNRVMDAKVVLVVGNGGIAMELVHSLVSKQACQVWCYPVNCKLAGIYAR